MRQHLVIKFIFCLYCILVIFGMFHHEPWRDEAHPWMDAKINSPISIIQTIRYIGTPVLWTMILTPFAKLGFPYITMQIIHALLAITTVYLMLFKSPFPFVVKILLPFSYFLAYEYAVVSRNYVLTILLLCVIAVCYTKRFTRPILYAAVVTLLFQTNSFSMGPAAVLVIFYMSDMFKKKLLSPKLLFSILLMISGGFLTYLSIKPDPELQYLSLQPDNLFTEILRIMRNGIVPSFPNIADPFSIYITILTSVACGLILLGTGNISLFIVSCSIIGWIFYVNSVLHSGNLRHNGLLFVYLLFIWWISIEQSIKSQLNRFFHSVTTIVLCALVGGSCYYTAFIFNADFLYPFSAAKDMANYLSDNSITNFPVIAYPASTAEAILPYFDKPVFWYPEFNAKGFFEVTDFQYHNRYFQFSPESVFSIIHKEYPLSRPLYLLMDTPVWPPYTEEYLLLHQSKSVYFWNFTTENFWLYRRKDR